jgi:GNAT superfamily N-acetyltransferase
MSVTLNWLGRDQIDRLARIRWQCYGARVADYDGFAMRARTGRHEDGDACIATQDGLDVGTATALSQHMHLRGKRIATQGVVWVGTAKSHRRRGSDQRGVASRVMDALIDKARERQQSASALMPFRVSFYEHFGFGLVERHNVWSVPTSLLPNDPDARWRFGSKADMPAMLACRAQQVKSGTCDVETDEPALVEWFAGLTDDTQLFVDDRDGKIVAYTWLRTLADGDQTIAQLAQPAWASIDGFRSVISLLGSLKDQYGIARLALPTDLPLNWLLRERQIPHRKVEHLAPKCTILSRMQVNVIDPVAFLHGQTLPRPARQSVVVEVMNYRQEKQRFSLDLSAGIIDAKPSNASADLQTSDVIFSSIACGELRASTAKMLGLINVTDPDKLSALDLLADGSAPFCYEYF